MRMAARMIDATRGALVEGVERQSVSPILAFTLGGRCSECVRGRLPLPEALRDELGALLLAPALQRLEV